MDERVEINASTQSLSHGLDITFTNTTGHGLGDCWTFVAQPTHVIVTILDSNGTSQVNRTFLPAMHWLLQLKSNGNWATYPSVLPPRQLRINFISSLHGPSDCK